jgi:hypothetical protein
LVAVIATIFARAIFEAAVGIFRRAHPAARQKNSFDG